MLSAIEGLGYSARPFDAAVLDAAGSDKTAKELIRAVAVAGFAAGNIMLLSVSVWSGASDATRDLFHWISALIALPAIAYAGRPFFRSAWRALSARSLNMDVPISLARDARLLREPLRDGDARRACLVRRLGRAAVLPARRALPRPSHARCRALGRGAPPVAFRAERHAPRARRDVNACADRRDRAGRHRAGHRRRARPGRRRGTGRGERHRSLHADRRIRPRAGRGRRKGLRRHAQPDRPPDHPRHRADRSRSSPRSCA